MEISCRYPPHWVPLEQLYEAMASPDPTTGLPRGFLRLGLHPRLDSVLFTLAFPTECVSSGNELQDFPFHSALLLPFPFFLG